MVPDIKYFGVNSMNELMLLVKNALAEKSEQIQFLAMPEAVRYLGKTVQYVGETNVSFVRGHFYYSNGTRWSEVNMAPDVQSQIEILNSLPTWATADPTVLYIIKDTSTRSMALYLKNPNVADGWYTIESGGAFAIVSVLPQWGDADANTIYFKADGNTLTGYIKKTGVMGAWYTLGGGSSEIVIDTVLSPSSTNPVQNKVIYSALQDIIAQVSSIYHYKGSCETAELPVSGNQVGDVWNLEDAGIYGPIGTNVAWDGGEWDALGGDQVPDPVPTQGSEHSVQSGGVYDALEAKEDVANKVTELDASSTDDQYPSAKAVYDALEDLEPIPPGFVQNVDTTMQPVEDGKMMRIGKTAFDALPSRDPDTFYYVPEEHDLLDAKPTCQDVNGDNVTGQKIVELTQTQYDNLPTKDPDTYYVIKDASTDARLVTRKPAWSQAVAVTVAQLQAGYTAPADGIIVGYIHTATASSLKAISVNGVAVAVAYGTSADINIGQFQVQINAEDVVTYPAGTVNSASINFVPFEDSIVGDPVTITPELIRNMNMPDLTHLENISAAQINAGYTVQHRGLFVFTGYNDTSSGVRIKINGVDVAILYGVASSGPRCGYVQMPVKPGDIIKSEHVSSDALLCYIAPYLAQ